MIRYLAVNLLWYGFIFIASFIAASKPFVRVPFEVVLGDDSQS